MRELLYGAAYYDEYMPYDRLEKDVAMMKKAGINTVRIAESTWSTCEPQEGVFDFSHVIRVMDAMEEAEINVIIGTPTYAVPTWMVKAYPDVRGTINCGRQPDPCVCSSDNRDSRDSKKGSQHQPGCNSSTWTSSDSRFDDGRDDEGR